MKNLKKVFHVALIALMLMLHFGCKKSHDPTDNRQGQVVGTVTDANGEPISGMKVTLSGINEEDQVTTSGNDGKYSFDNVTYRTHAVTFEKDGWLAFFFSSRRRHTRFSRDWSSDVCSSD